VCYYVNKWSKADWWRTIWINILTQNRRFLDLSSLELDGSYTLARNGGDAVGYQGRKACNTTNSLFVPDSQGFILTISTLQKGQYHDLYQIQLLFGTHIFDEQLYAARSVIEHANAWIDGFKALLVRFEFSVKNWMSLHFIAFAVIFLRKISRKKKV
jgi:hypothetical protein